MKQANSQQSIKPASDTERRNHLIQELPLTLGAKWALDCCREAVQGGRLEGGWPGTVPEARIRVLQELTRELAEQRLPPPTPGELAAATSSAYERAKRDWQLAAKSSHARTASDARRHGRGSS